MKILHVNSYYNTGKFYKNIFDRQIDNNLEIKVYVPTIRTFKFVNFDYGKYTMISRINNKYDRIIFHLKHKKIYKDIKEKNDILTFNLVHAHSLFSNGYIAYKLKKEFNIPYIVAVRNTDINVFFKYMIHLRRLGVKILNNASNIIFLSESYKNKLIDEFIPESLKEKILNTSTIIPNGIDDYWLENKNSSKHHFSGKIINIIYAGTIDKNKNLITTVKAIDILKQNGYKIKYTVVGRVINKNVFNYIMKYPFVEYISQQPKEELIKLYREHDIFVMPSINETFGLVYAEAMSQGLPVIYSKGQGFDKQFEEGCVGYHVNCFDEVEIADKILCILNNYNEFYNNCIKLCNKFNWQTIVQEYQNIYTKIMLN